MKCPPCCTIFCASRSAYASRWVLTGDVLAGRGVGEGAFSRLGGFGYPWSFAQTMRGQYVLRDLTVA